MTNWREMIVDESENANKADGWFTPGRFALILACFITAAFSGILFGQETFFYRDFGLFGYPLAAYQRECFWRGELPLWNPLNFCGLPFLAQWNTMTLYPPSLFYLIFPLSWSLGVFNLAHMFWAGLGMYFLAHRWTHNRLAASVAGIAYAFNGLTWHCLMWPNNISALGWMPWVVLLVEQAWRMPKVQSQASSPEALSGWRRFFLPSTPSRAVILAGLAGTMQMLAGAPEIILLTWALLGAMWLAQFLWGKIPKGQMLMRTPVVVILVSGLSAAQLLPFMELLAYSQRDAGFSKSEWELPLSGPANFLVPLFHCYQAGHGVFVQYDQYWVASHYLGVGLMALAIMGALFVRKRRVWFLLALALLCIWMAFGAHGFLYPLARKGMPLLGLMRYPIKFIVLPVFIIPLLAAYGVRWFQEQTSGSNFIRARKVLRNVALILFGLIAIIVAVEWKFPLIADDWNATWQCALVRAVFVLAIPGILILMQRAAEFKIRVLLRFLLLALLWADVYTHAPNLSPTVQRSVYQPEAMRPLLKLPSSPMAGEPRFMVIHSAMEKLHNTSLRDPRDEYTIHRLAFYDNCNLLDDVPKTDGFFSLYLRQPLHGLSLVYVLDEQNVDLKGMKDFLCIAHVTSPEVDPNKALDWLPRDTAMPLVAGGQQPMFASEKETDAALMSPSFNPREAVYLPLFVRDIVKAERTKVKITSQRIAAQRISFTTETISPAMITIAQAYYRPWHAYVDGRRANLYPANVGFQAVQVPAGKHEVRVVYEDRAFELGAMISLGTLLAVGLCWIASGPKRKD